MSNDPHDRTSDDYRDLIRLPHHVSRRHPQMSLYDRAAQFSPFAALNGYGDSITETARLTSQRPQLDESEKERLDERLRMLQYELLNGKPQTTVTVTYFVADEKKSGGALHQITGTLKKIDSYTQQVWLWCQTEEKPAPIAIPLDDMIDIACGETGMDES